MAYLRQCLQEIRSRHQGARAADRQVPQATRAVTGSMPTEALSIRTRLDTSAAPIANDGFADSAMQPMDWPQI